MAEAVTRLVGAIEAVRDAVRASLDRDPIVPWICADDDLINDLGVTAYELESLSLIVEEVFGIELLDDLWRTPLYRTPASLAEWVLRKADEAAWEETQRQRRWA